MFVVRLHFIVIVAALLSACASAAPRAPSEPIESVGQEHPADHIAAARYLPHAVQLLAVTDDLTELVDTAGRDGFIQKFRKQYEEAAFELVGEVGYNLLSPEALADLGVDAHAQAGFAVDGARDGDISLVVFVTLSQPERFKNLAYMVATGHVGGKRLRQHVHGDGVAVGRGDVALVVVGDLALVILGGRAFARAKEWLALEPAETLGQHRPFRVAMRNTERDSSLRGYFDIRAALFSQASMDPRWAGRSVSEAKSSVARLHRRALAAARANAASEERIMAIDARYEPLYSTLADGSFEERVRSLFGGIGGGDFSLQWSSRGVDITAHVDIQAQALIANVVRAREGEPPLASALTELPGFMLGLFLDLPALAKLARQLDVPLAEVNILLGADLENDLLPLLTGEISAAWLPPKAGFAAVQGTEDVRAALLVGIADAKKVEEILTRFAGRTEGNATLTNLGPRRWKVTLPRVGVVELELRDKVLVVATDGGIGAGAGSGAPPPPEGAKSWRLVTSTGSGVELYVRMHAVAAAILWLADSSAAPYVFERLPWHDPQHTHSVAYQAKLGEINANEQAILRTRNDGRARGRAMLVAAAAGLGAAGLSLRPTARGIALEGSYHTRGQSVAAAAAAMLEVDRGHGSGQGGGHEDAARIEQLKTTRKRLHGELDALYEAERRAAATPPQEKSSPAKAPGTKSPQARRRVATPKNAIRSKPAAP